MSRRFICTVGTSIAGDSYEALALAEISSESGKSATEALKEMKEEVDARRGKPERQRKMSAELTSLFTIDPPINANDQVLLLYSDTVLGKLCAEALAYALTQFCNLRDNDIELAHVKGLRTDKFERFRREGVRNLFALAIKYVEGAGLTVDNPDYKNTAEIILNPTGGYKATVPYLTLLGGLYGMKVIYISEESKELIVLPPLPISYDLRVLRQARPLLERLAQKDGTECLELARLSNEERQLYNGLAEYAEVLIENVEGLLTLTPLGYLFYQRFASDYPAGWVECSTPIDQKKIHFRDDHGTNTLMVVGRKLVTSSYVCEIVNSLPFNRSETNRIRPNQSFENGLVEIVLTKTDAGLGLVLKTSGRSPQETEKIARHLSDRYKW